MKAIRRVARALQYASCLPLFVMIVLTSSDVVARYALSTSVPDTAELSAMMLGLSISLSLAHTTLNGEQVRFDLLLGRLRPTSRMIVDALNLLISASIFVLIFWQAVKRVGDSFGSGEYIGSMEVPLWPAKAVFALGCGLTALALVAALVASLRGTGREHLEK